MENLVGETYRRPGRHFGMSQIHNQASIEREQPETPSSRTTHPLSDDHPAGAAAAPAPVPVGHPAPVDDVPPPSVLHDEIDEKDTISCRRSSDRAFPAFYDHVESNADYGIGSRSFEGSLHVEQIRSMDYMDRLSTYSHGRETTSWSSTESMEDLEVEMDKLEIELKQSMLVYCTACKEAKTARQKMEEVQTLGEAGLAEDAALAIAKIEKAKCEAAMETVKLAERLAELETQKINNDIEMSVKKEAEDERIKMEAVVKSNGRYGKYTIADIEFATYYSLDRGTTSLSSTESMEGLEGSMKMLEIWLKTTMDLFIKFFKEWETLKQKLHCWKMEEEKRLEEARLAEDAALAMEEKEKAMKCKVGMEAVEQAAQSFQPETQNEEGKEKKEAIQMATDYLSDARKIGEGVYGPVYKCELDHTPVAIKVLHRWPSQRSSHFQKEVHVLSSIRHPNVVPLLGACPQLGCLVYEYMANGSLEDCLLRRGAGDNVSHSIVLSWQMRFRIAAEIANALLFLHQTKPEPVVHGHLKPANILLDRDLVSKISDVGLARWVSPNEANTSVALFYYIDVHSLGIKSDVYSLGVLLLQLITARQPFGLAHHVERAIEDDTFEKMLDPLVPDWPVEEATSLAKMALKCADLWTRSDRPDLGDVIVPELNRLRALADNQAE